MHEMALMASMLELIEDQARVDGFHKVVRVDLEIGRLSGVEPEAMRFAFDVGTEDSLVAGAELFIEEPEGLARCEVCGVESAIEMIFDPCPECGKGPMEILAGRDMRIVSLEVE